MKENTRIMLLVTILDRGKGTVAMELFTAAGLHLHYAAPGKGTANSDILDYLGLGETEKDIVLTLLPCSSVPAILKRAGERLRLTEPGRGILFTMPLSAVGGAVARLVNQEAQETDMEKETTMEQGKNDLIVVVVNNGCNDAVMAAAKSAGARGGTILHGRRLGEEDGKSGDGGVHPEKDIVAILAPRAQRKAIMEAVNRQAGIATESRGVLFSLPVEDVLGLSLLDGQVTAE